MGPSGATTYDRVLAQEIKDKYRYDPNVHVTKKPWVRLEDEHHTHFTVPELPWKRGENG